MRNDEVHVWRVQPEIPLGELQQRAACLTADERGRASRFRQSADRRRYVAHRSALREILGVYLGLEARQVELYRDRLGKPHLAGVAATGWQFSVSHSGDIGLVAIRRGKQVGVDVEQVIPGFDWREVAALTLSQRERRGLDAQPADKQCEAFFAIWTRKEALAKAVGSGLRLDFPAVEVPTDLCLGGRTVLRLPAEDGEVECAIVDLPVGKGSRAALASIGGPARVRGFEWLVRGSPVTDHATLFDAQPGPESIVPGPGGLSGRRGSSMHGGRLGRLTST